MTKPERAALLHYIRWMADAMGLRDWTVALGDSPCDNKLSAQCSCTNGQKHVTISVCADFRGMPIDEVRETIVHELVHAHFEPCWQQVRADLLEHLGQATYNVFVDSFRRNMEYSVDGISRAIAGHMPTIDWKWTDE